VTVRDKPFTGTVSGEQAVCGGSEVTLMPTVPGGTWKSEDESRATVDSDGRVTGISEGDVYIWYIVTGEHGCSDSVSHKITVNAGDSFDYPDIRLRLCTSIGTVNLSKYLYTSSVNTVSWSGISILPDGTLDASTLYTPATYTYTYTVTGCSGAAKIRKAYVKTLRSNESPRLRDTVVICHEHADAVNINQLFGLESGGTLTCDNAAAAPYITPAPYGGTVFDGKKYYSDRPKDETYHGVPVTTVSFTYTPSGCLAGKTYKTVIVLTEDMMK
jgi:hypothetical protein